MKCKIRLSSASLGMGWGCGLAELGEKTELNQLGVKLGLNLSLEDFPGGVEEKWKYSKAQLQLGLPAA